MAVLFLFLDYWSREGTIAYSCVFYREGMDRTFLGIEQERAREVMGTMGEQKRVLIKKCRCTQSIIGDVNFSEGFVALRSKFKGEVRNKVARN